MRISIITPSFNQGKFIGETIRSVMSQDHPDVEHIVIDGQSTDETVSILRQYPHLQWVSEKDSGQSNAINKGFTRSTGQILAWLNSDDYYEANIFGGIVRYFEEHPECMLLYGDITFVDREGRTLSHYAGGTIGYRELVRCPDIVRQPSFFWRRDVVDEIGGVDEVLHLVMDFDFFLRIAQRHPFHYVPGNLSYYRYYDENKSLSLARKQVAEIYHVYRKNKIPFSPRVLKYLAAKYARAHGLGGPVNLASRLLRARKHPA